MFKLFWAPGSCALASHIALDVSGRRMHGGCRAILYSP
jgi:hypothetical protein